MALALVRALVTEVGRMLGYGYVGDTHGALQRDCKCLLLTCNAVEARFQASSETFGRVIGMALTDEPCHYA
jgi:hypothetical protein